MDASGQPGERRFRHGKEDSLALTSALNLFLQCKLSPTFISTMDKVLALLKANKPIRDGEFSSSEVDMVIKKLGCVSCCIAREEGGFL